VVGLGAEAYGRVCGDRQLGSNRRHLVLFALVSKKIVLARETIKITAGRVVAAPRVKGRRWISVLLFVPMKIFWIQEALATGRAHVRLLAHVCLLVTTGYG